MRAPSPSQLIEREAEQVVSDALDDYVRRTMMIDKTNPQHYQILHEDPVFVEKCDPRTGTITMVWQPDYDDPYKYRPYRNEEEKHEWLKALQKADARRKRTAKRRERRARRQQGKQVVPLSAAANIPIPAAPAAPSAASVEVNKTYRDAVTRDVEALRSRLYRGNKNPGSPLIRKTKANELHSQKQE